MKINMFAALVVVTSTWVSSSAIAGSQARESVCLAIGKYAESAAEAREDGRPEDESQNLLTRGKKGTPEGDLYVALKQVVTWVYTVQPKPADARKLVYTKCLAREFFAYNPKLDG